MLRCVVIDDEPLAATLLEKLLTLQSDVDVCATFTDSIEALQNLPDINSDVVFLDIDMPGIDGLSMAKKINEFKYPPHIIFTTAHSDYMLEALRNQAFDFLTKPIDLKELLLCIKRIEQRKIELVRKHFRDEKPFLEQLVKFN